MLNKVKQFIEGNLNMLEDKVFGKPLYYKEQIIYRMKQCPDCNKEGKCRYCGCSVPGKHYVEETCNRGDRFPDLMNETDWNQYKKDNNIEIKVNDN